MSLPSSGEIKASQINTEAGRSSDAEAPLSGSSSTPQAGSLVKIYEGSGVDQSAPHSYSEFYGISYDVGVLSDVEYGEGQGPDDFYYDSSIGDASNLSIGDIIYTDSALTNPVDDSSYNPMSQAASSATTTFCSVTGSYMYMLVNPANGAITSVNCFMFLTDVFYDTSAPIDYYTYYYDSSIGDASNLDVGDTVYSNAQLTTTLPADTYYQAASSASTTHCSQSGYMMSMTVNSSGVITNIFCGLP